MNNFNYYSAYSSLNNNVLFDLAKFIVEENYKHHDIYNIKTSKDEMYSICQEEETFNNSKIFITRDIFNSIVGSIRIVKWNNIDTLPIQKLFNIDVDSFVRNNHEVWHIGRFAIRKGADKKGFNIFKTLMVLALNEVCNNEKSVVLAECDAKLLRVLKLLGLEAEVLADSINYLGSETIPVMFSYSSLKVFVEKNQQLLYEGMNSLHESVVFQSVA